MPHRGERGQMLPLIALVIAAAAFAAVLIGRLGVRASNEAQAAAAADAAALAAAQGGAGDGGLASLGRVSAESRARAAAVANGARVVSYQDEGDTVRVEVEISGSAAVGRAARGVDTIDPGLRAAVARANQLLGRTVPEIRARADGLAVQFGGVDATDVMRIGVSAGLCPATGGALTDMPPGAKGDVWFQVCDPPPTGTSPTSRHEPVRSPDGAPGAGQAQSVEPAEE